MSSILFNAARYHRRPDESVLDALIRGGAGVPYSCRKGSCHTCMMRVLRGDPGDAARDSVDPDLRDSGHFLPCLSHPDGDLEVAVAERAQRFVAATVAIHERMAGVVTRLLLEPHETLSWRPGQYIGLRRSDGLIRSYSIASRVSDYYLEIHVRDTEGGDMSSWLRDEVRVGSEVELQGPFGSAVYDPAFRDRALLLVGGGTGIAPLVGVLREALAQGHAAPIRVFHGARTRAELYLDSVLRALIDEHDGVEYLGCADDSAAVPPPGLLLERAFAGVDAHAPPVLFMAGPPDMVYAGRVRAVAAGIHRAETFCDPFEGAAPYMPDDGAKVASVAAQPDIWGALGEGAKLRPMLDDFYERVYVDPLLAPYFQGIPRKRVVDKQYEFLRDLFTNARTYLGMRPFNAHHWMVIDDALFDYREDLFERVVLEHGFDPVLWRRWAAIHELFRREIVKSASRGMVIDGVERRDEGYSMEALSVATLCDGCGRALDVGETVRLQHAEGKVYCTDCGAQDVVGGTP